MINRVSDNNYTNPYAENRKKVSETQDAPAFLLNYDEKGVVWDRDKNEKDKEESVGNKPARQNNSSAKKQRDTYESSVTKSSDDEKNEDKTASPFDSLKKVFQTVADNIKSAFKSLFKFVWYGNDDADKNFDINNDLNVVDEKESDDIKIEKEIIEKQESLNASREKYKSSMDAEYYQKLERARKGVSGVPARNTSLLTTYDKHGEIKKINASESDMVLRGDKSIKL